MLMLVNFSLGVDIFTDLFNAKNCPYFMNVHQVAIVFRFTSICL